MSEQEQQEPDWTVLYRTERGYEYCPIVGQCVWYDRRTIGYRYHSRTAEGQERERKALQEGRAR